MRGFLFAEPQLVHVLWAVVASLALLLWLERRGGHALGRFVSPVLQDRLVSRPSALRRVFRFGLLGLAGVFLVLALMRPQWGGETVRSSRVGAQIMIAVDVSRSMLAEDVAPNRLERAKAEIRDLLGFMDGNQVGFIAFAGRASVVAPLTPDFGFLRLVLDTIDVDTVRRGGTRLEEPIRKAVAGFGEAGDLSRILLLITDGEDHDSFALDAAKEAAERGIRIIAVGFGDEAGSEIRITDPRSGARSLLRDAEGRPVISRLDGDGLRELALATQGAYIPAGTGVLDLESIFEAHIAPLMHSSGDTRVRSVRNEGYQWAVLAALLCLLGSVSTQAAPRWRAGTTASVLALTLAMAGSGAARAQTVRLQPTEEPAAVESEAPVGDAETGQARASLEVPEDARDAYNSGLRALSAEQIDDAEQLFEASRSQAGIDGEARFRATYNLGWTDVLRSDANLDADPAAALASLERAADWFRSAIALRPKHEESRRNLEIVLQRILALADSLAQHEPQELRERLEELIARQRAALPAVRTLVERVATAETPHAVDAMRHEFRQSEVEERAILSSAQELSRLAGNELEALENVPEEEQSPEDRLRAAQLAGVLHYVHRGRERMGQARSQLRQRQAERAYRRAAASLEALKRARDQLLDPVAVLDAVLGDAAELMRETRVLAALSSQLGLDDTDASTPPPWLSPQSLAERQAEMHARTEELAARLRAGLGSGEAVEDPEQRALLEQVAEAEPLVSEGGERFQEALQELEGERVAEALPGQALGIAALAQARERFFDLKRLIEAAYADQRRIDAILDPEPDPATGASAEDALAQLPEFAPTLAAVQTENVSRLERMQPLVDRQLDALATPPAVEEGEDPAAAQEAWEQQRQSLAMATELLALTEAAMRNASEQLPSLADSTARLESIRRNVDQSIDGLEALRRIFFTMLEHLRDAARQQTELGDETADATALAAAEPEALASRLAPIAGRQRQLSERTEQLAQALHEQSFEDPAKLLGSDQPLDDETAQEVTERFVRASELVLSAHEEMRAAAEGMAAAPPSVEAVRQQQDAALDALLRALEALQPPPPPQDSQQGEDDQQQQQQQQGSQPQEQEGPSEDADPSQLLQQVRDREAERHRDRRERGSLQNEPVEKDW